jgi:hypothetical protein
MSSKLMVEMQGGYGSMACGDRKSLKRSGEDGSVESRYGMPHKNVLSDVWHLMDFACSRHLQAVMKDLMKAFAANGHLMLDAMFKRDMEQMSHCTINRLLRHDRESLVAHGRSTTTPGRLQKLFQAIF